MDEKYIWPLVGVAFGSFLAYVIGRLNSNSARRGRVGRVLMHMLRSRTDLAVIISTTEKFKEHQKDFEDYEHLRKHVSSKRFMEPEVRIENFRKAIDDLSADYPMESVRFQGTLDALLALKGASFTESAKVPRLYIQNVSAHEAMLELSELEVERQIRAVAWLHGPTTFVRVLLAQRRNTRRRLKADAFSSDYLKDAYEELNRVAPKSTPAE